MLDWFSFNLELWYCLANLLILGNYPSCNSLFQDKKIFKYIFLATIFLSRIGKEQILLGIYYACWEDSCNYYVYGIEYSANRNSDSNIIMHLHIIGLVVSEASSLYRSKITFLVLIFIRCSYFIGIHWLLFFC